MKGKEMKKRRALLKERVLNRAGSRLASERSKDRSRVSLRVLLCGVLLLAPSVVSAQTNLETNAGIQFNFSTPGAGNLALGGAFLALANDATTAYTNPAGLTNVLEPELHLEVRGWSYTHVFTDHGRLEGEAPTNCLDTIPLGGCPDTIPGLRDGEAEDRVWGASFFSYVYPRKRWAAAFYRHELANFEANFETQGAFLERTRSRSPFGIPGERDGRLASLRNTMTLDIVNHGVSIAYSIKENISLGLGLSYYDFSMSSVTDRFVPPLFEQSSFEEEKVVNSQIQTGDDAELGFNLGFFWESSSQVWGIGGVYRQGPKFELDAVSRRGPGALLEFPEASQKATFDVPDVLGVGISYKPTDAIRVAFDYDRIGYGDLTKDFVDIFDLDNFLADPDLELDDFVIDNASELHLGFEYTFLRPRIPFAVRAGAWYDPDHSLRFEGENVAFGAIFRRRSDEMHYSFGIGIYPRKFQVEFAFDFSRRISTSSLSAVFRL